MLAVFDKHHNNWSTLVQDSADWNDWVSKKEEKELKKTKVLLRLVKSQGLASVEDVKLEKNGEWGPQHVHVVKGLDKLLSVKGNIREGTGKKTIQAEIGDLVLVKTSDFTKRGMYGVITEIHGEGTATVHTKDGDIKRAIGQLCPLAGDCLSR